MTKLLSTLVLLIISITSFAQYKISGTVTEEGRPVSNVTVLLLMAADSSLIKSALSNKEGHFYFEQLASGKYIVSITKIGTKQIMFPAEIVQKNVHLETINLTIESKALSGVTVTARRPFLEQRADKLVVNVENSATAAGGTALEVLQKVPGIVVTNDNISMV
ncbi:MAG TPA: carboxypeptidase-like regulatory domain-containing protein, partial [Flavisolibacter sp.]|nr:carboxypeptidase-like regulatory domain-containing protein [Flavisolibacter sp.]